MALRVQVGKRASLVRFFVSPFGKTLLAAFVIFNTIALGAFTYFYVKYARLVDARLATGSPFQTASMLFAAPSVVAVGDETTPDEILVQLRRAGYSENRANRMGWYNRRPDNAVEVFPGPDSFFRSDAAVLKIANNKVVQIISLRDNTEITQYLLEPELMTNLFDRKREKRRLVRFSDIPPVMVNALLAAEDKRFFQHSGFDPVRILGAAYKDLKEGRKAEGASTLSMQLARDFFLDKDSKTWERKFAEVMITLHLEQKLTKQQIFEYYANQAYLGRRGSFAIHGVGEGAQAFFGKDLSQLTVAEAATLAGSIQKPLPSNPAKAIDRTRARRNTVLAMMRDDGFITEAEYNDASNAPVTLVGRDMESTDAPYFVDFVNDWLQQQFQDHDFQNNVYRVYTTLDLDLQKAAAQAVAIGMKEVDEQIKRRTKKGDTPPQAQVALVALDPQTGEIKALIGGRDYGQSQLNRAIAKRQPGSVFKPFVYAAAISTALADSGGSQPFTTVTPLIDEPTTFWYDGRPYEPNNYKSEFHGQVTLRQAIAKSMNIPTVKIAEAVGYRNVVDLARRAGLNMEVRPTPSVALGAYEVTPVEIAGAYTMYANRGIYTKPNYVSMIRDVNGRVLYENKAERRVVLDPRVDYIMVSLLEEVMRTGTAAGVRSRGFVLPAAGKTGTSRDGWFAGFTSKLVCAVWVGFDDGKELKIEGARSALPIWTEFMKRAHQFREYRSVTSFTAPEGVVAVQVDPATGQLATTACPNPRTDVFIAGTQPAELCRLHHGGATQIAGWDTAAPSQPAGGSAGTAAVGSAPPAARPVQPSRPRETAQSFPVNPSSGTNGDRTASPEKKEEKKKGFFGRIRDIFK